MKKKIVQTNSNYPAHIDVELEENYYLDRISVFLPEEGYCRYSVFTSMDGRDFDLLAEKTSKKSCDPETGDVFSAGGKEARIIRVYIEYNSASSRAELRDLKVEGRKSNTPVRTRPKLEIGTFADSVYNVNVTPGDTIEEVYGIIARRIGEQYRAWFDFRLEENPKGNGYDYFALSDADGRTLVRGNTGVSLAAGLNHYLKYYCQVNLSQVGDRTGMPECRPTVGRTVFRETKAKVRYAYNYCTLSYSMAFWGEKEWRRELDWLALNGVNVVLDAIAQEEVWRRFLGRLGYTHEEIKAFIAGPAYYAWAYMGNLSGFGGPVHDTWFEERTELARKNQLIMRRLGMSPVKQGYSGMVPTDIVEHDSYAEVIPQGKWNSFDRPAMLKTTSPAFRKYAAEFYRAQDEVYGTDSHYYATDPFHEGGNTAGMSVREVAKGVLQALLQADPEGIWIIQAWQHNPASELLEGIAETEKGRDHALILDLYAEKTPHYDEGGVGRVSHGYAKEFNHTPWVFCMLNNFGGRLGLHGHLDNLAEWIPRAFNTCEKIAGIGITPEAGGSNPVLYDFLFEMIWQENAEDEMPVISLKEWLKGYTVRRYGVASEAAYQAWLILMNTVYRAELNQLGQGAPESVINARPALEIKAASTWGNAVISYDKAELKKAAKLLLKDYARLEESEGYRYDLVTVLQQILSNTAQDTYGEMIDAYRAKDLPTFEACAEKYLAIADKMDEILSASEYYLLGKWVEAAKALAEKADDFTEKLYEFNARALITTWGAFEQSETGKLHDYSNRQWSGLIADFYKPRWERFIRERIRELKGEPYIKDIPWFEWEWEWVRDRKAYPAVPEQKDIYTLGKKILEM